MVPCFCRVEARHGGADRTHERATAQRPVRAYTTRNFEEAVKAVVDDDLLFHQTFRDSPIGMAIVDEVGYFVEVNAAFATILGVPVDQLVRRHFAEFTHPDDLKRDIELRQQLADGSMSFYQVQKRFVRATGDLVWARVTVSDVGRNSESQPTLYAVQVEDITEIRRTKEILEHRALYDHLTGLANRTLLLDSIAHALERHALRTATVACVFMDVDHFKVVNDSLGHEAGDSYLTQIAARIQDAVRPIDTVSRLGGDEFVILLEGVTDQKAAEQLVAEIIAQVQAPLSFAGHELAPTVSAGLALAEPGVSAEGLVRNADMAMYAAKQSGRARVEVFNPGLRASATNKLSIEAELRTGIRDGELVVHYQPVVELATKRIVAFEALVRWQHPQRGLLLPDEFISISEEANLMVPLGSLVLQAACAFVAAHRGFEGQIFVNVSTRQIGTADLARAVTEALESNRVDARRLALEITESGILMATQAAHADLEAIASLGVDLILDDFGTGYSSLSSVLQNPIAGIKLAREFTLRLGDGGTGDRISVAMASLTKSLAMYGVIEGVETEAQYLRARSHGWKLGQGFLFGHPVPAEQIIIDQDGAISIGVATPDAGIAP
jgi:diguanylate cyclase (GGDEF)-like protein/PAS domain S-box-containing protein